MRTADLALAPGGRAGRRPERKPADKPARVAARSARRALASHAQGRAADPLRPPRPPPSGSGHACGHLDRLAGAVCPPVSRAGPTLRSAPSPPRSFCAARSRRSSSPRTAHRRQGRFPRPAAAYFRPGCSAASGRPRAGLPQDYLAALTQRNAGLRRVQLGYADRTSLDPWTARVAELGAALNAARREALTALGPGFAERAAELGLAGAGLGYDADAPTVEQLEARSAGRPRTWGDRARAASGRRSGAERRP